MTMTESILKSLMKLFAMVAQIHNMDKYEKVRKIVEEYLLQLVRAKNMKQYLIMYDFYFSGFREREVKTGEKQLSLLSVKAMLICEDVNRFLDKRQKIIILLQLLEILKLENTEDPIARDFLRTVVLAFKFTDKIFDIGLKFVSGKYDLIQDEERLLFVDSSPRSFEYDSTHYYLELLKGQLVFLWIDQPGFLLFKYEGEKGQLSFNGKPVIPNKTYLFEKSGVIKNPIIGNLFYGDILKRLMHSMESVKINLLAENIEYSFPDSSNGIRPFNLIAEGGQLIGILGGSGVGKTTLLSILSGNLNPDQGSVKLNGYDVHNESEKLEGIIGYISQDDLLIEELTVYENIYFNARLCFRDYSIEQIIKKIHKILVDLNLYEIRDLKVGSALEKYISGGQRKRLNIALELIREPFVLFVDEPTSGLSSADSLNVIEILKQQTLNGKLVIINFHQPSSDIFKMFDKILVMDEGGRIAFLGSPTDTIPYFKTHFKLIDANESECPVCGNIYPEQALQVLELKQVNDFGEITAQRQMSPEDWYHKYREEIDEELVGIPEVKTDLPQNDFKVPDRFTQFKIFWQRNVFSKLADRQYLVINFLEAPILAFILAWFSKYNAGDETSPSRYIFSQNVNLPVYIFMLVIVAIFLGLMVSAEEIIRDRRILKREKFLHLNRHSYYNSKVVYLLLLAIFQSLLFVLVGNSILHIKNMYFQYWLIMSVTAFLAGLLGLNISSAMHSVVSIYILIPLLIIPQILLGGAMVKYDKLHSSINNPEYVPFIGDLMPSRWAYEALAVFQFRENKYEQLFFKDDDEASSASFYTNYVLPLLDEKLTECENNIRNNQKLQKTESFLQLITNELTKISKDIGEQTDWSVFSEIDNFNLNASKKIRQFIKKANAIYLNRLDTAVDSRDSRLRNLSKMFDNDYIIKLRNDYYNEQLAEIILNKRDLQKTRIEGSKIIRLADPGFLNSEMKMGRAHFYAPYKRFGNFYIDTLWFNFIVLVIITGIFYVFLINEVIQHLFRRFSDLRSQLKASQIIEKIKNVVKPLHGD